jgi:hypothetical protein
MKSIFFIIVSLSRCGSTTIHRALNSHSEIDCLFEPDFANADWDEQHVKAELGQIRLKYSGIKHVWDPSGFPFVGTHTSSITEMDFNYGRVLALNVSLLSVPDKKVLFLRRRNQLERILSDLLGQQTELWGPVLPDGQIVRGLDESRKYRDEIKAKSIQPVNIKVIEWYLDHVTVMEDALRNSVPDDECLDLFYEDLFGFDVSLGSRLACYQSILDFLGFPTDPSYWDRPMVEALLHPKAKLNNSSTLGLIPNLKEVQQRFSKISLVS